MEILLFLPTKSLIRFQLVSQHWQSLIRSEFFYHLHHHHSTRCAELQLSFIFRTITSQFFICHPSIKKLVPFRFPFPYVKILQSCNGLLLLECRNSSYGQREHHVFNPATKRSRNLFLSNPHCGLCLIFDPSKSHHCMVVCFRRGRNYYTSFRVYDSRTHTWKDGAKSLVGRHNFFEGVYRKGGLYFIRIGGSSSFCFSLKDGICSIPDPPRIESRRVKKSYIMESNGHLLHIVMSLRPIENRLCVLEMSDDESGWFMNFRADLNPISAAFAASKGRAIDLLGVVRGEKEEDSLLLFHVPGKIMIYRFSGEAFEVLVDFTSENYYR